MSEVYQQCKIGKATVIIKDGIKFQNKLDNQSNTFRTATQWGPAHSQTPRHEQSDTHAE